MKPVSAAGKFVMRMFADQYLRHAGYRPCNGHSYIMAPGAPADAVTIEPDNYLYSSILNGHHDDVYVGLGSGAYTYTHSHIATNEAGREKYVEDAAAGGDAILASPVPPDVAAGRSLILRLPYNGRLSQEKIDFGHADRRQLDQLRLFIDEGLVEERPGEYRLTKAGWYWYVNLMFAFHPPEIRKMAHDFVAGIVARAEKQGIACDGDMRILPEADRSLLFSIG
jgi:oxygen-independent coproporphyrinogen-3 oxidase